MSSTDCSTATRSWSRQKASASLNVVVILDEVDRDPARQKRLLTTFRSFLRALDDPEQLGTRYQISHEFVQETRR
jgi:hypothetical protein